MEIFVKWHDVLMRVALAALAALLGALTEQQHPGSLTGLVPPLVAPLLGAELPHVQSELRLFSPRSLRSPVPI